MEDIKKDELKSNIKRGIKIFFALTVLVLFVIFFLTADRNTLTSLKHFSPLHLIGAILLWGVMAGTDYLGFMVFTRGAGKNIRFIESMSVITIGQFLSLVTPFQVSGLPVQVFYLKKKCRIDYGEGTSLLFIRAVSALTIFLLSAPFVFMFAGEAFQNPIVKHTTRIIGILTIIVVVVVAFVMTRPRWFTRFMKGRAGKFLNQVFEFRKTFLNFFVKSWLYFIAGLLLMVISFTAYFMVAPVLMRGLGIPVSIIKVLLFQLILRFALIFSPSPGASGFAEAGFAGLFYTMIPKNLLGIYVSLWRFFTSYISAIIGGFLLMKFIKET